jgi:hypothetical protein
MRRRLGYLFAWAIATAVAVAGSWVGLQPLLDAAAAQRPPSLSASQLREAVEFPAPDPPATSAATPAPTPTASPSTPAPGTATAVVDDWQEVRGGRAVQRTFWLQGGEVVVRVSHARVEVMSHTPYEGYEVSINRWARDSVVVSFESPEHTSRLWVMWRDGPYAEITESA